MEISCLDIFLTLPEANVDASKSDITIEVALRAKRRIRLKVLVG